jgi:hypothetical protein
VLVLVHPRYFISPVPTISGEHIKEIMGVKGKPNIIEKKRLQRYGHVKRMPEERRKRGRPRKTWMKGVQAAMTTRNLEPDHWRNGGMAFGFRKMATAVMKLDGSIDRYFLDI